jgi:hypothetical protein
MDVNPLRNMNLKKKSFILPLLAIPLLAGMLLVTYPSNVSAQPDFLNLDEHMSSISNQTSMESMFSSQESLSTPDNSSNQNDIASSIMTFPDGQDGKDGLAGQDGKDGLAGQDGKDGLAGLDETVIP